MSNALGGALPSVDMLLWLCCAFSVPRQLHGFMDYSLLVGVHRTTRSIPSSLNNGIGVGALPSLDVTVFHDWVSNILLTSVTLERAARHSSCSPVGVIVSWSDKRACRGEKWGQGVHDVSKSPS